MSQNSATDSPPVLQSRHPKAFFEVLAAICGNVSANYVLDEQDQEKLLAIFNVINLKLVTAPRSEMHRNPAMAKEYFSSSFVADKNGFDAPQGGYGPPGSVEGSFCHHHEELSFQELHPDVDLATYGLPSPPRESERCTPSRWTNANTHRFHPYIPIQRPSSPPAVPPQSLSVIPTITIVDVDSVKQGLYKDTTSSTTMPDQPAQVEAENNKIAGFAIVGSTLAGDTSLDPRTFTSTIKNKAAERDSSVAKDMVSHDDSGIVMDDALMSHPGEKKDGDDASDDGGISFSQDSAYATQPSKDFDDDIGDDNNDELRSKSRSSSPPTNAFEVSAEEGELELPNPPQTKLSLEDQMARRSTRLVGKVKGVSDDTTGIVPTSSDSYPTSDPTSLQGKRKAVSDSDADCDSNDQEPDSKRVKLTES